MHLALLWLTGCSSSPEASGSCDDTGGRAVDDTAETGEAADTGECPLFGGTALPASNERGESHEWDVTICPTWSGIRDETYTYSVNRATGSRFNVGAVTTEFVVTQPLPDAGAGHFLEVSNSFVEGLHDDSPEAANSAMLRTDRHFVCDDEGLWLISEFSHKMGFHSADDSPALPLREGWACWSQAALLLPRELSVGTSWSAQCTGTWYRADQPDAVDCTFEFTVDQEAEVATPGGTWTALHVAPPSVLLNTPPPNVPA